MSTPIETNTEELQEILQTVNNLPNLGGGGFSIPVIDLEELGFAPINAAEAHEILSSDASIIDMIKTTMDCGLVKLIVPVEDTKTSFTCLCSNFMSEDSSEIYCTAEFMGLWYTIVLEVTASEIYGHMLQLHYIYKDE